MFLCTVNKIGFCCFQEASFSTGVAAPWVSFHGECTGVFLRTGEVQTSLFLQKLWEGEGEMERQTTWCRGHHGLSPLGNKLRASSPCVPWSPKLSFHTSLVPGACWCEFGGKNLLWDAALGCVVKHMPSWQLMRWQIRVLRAEITHILFCVWIAVLSDCPAADGSYS